MEQPMKPIEWAGLSAKFDSVVVLPAHAVDTARAVARRWRKLGGIVGEALDVRTDLAGELEGSF